MILFVEFNKKAVSEKTDAFFDIHLREEIIKNIRAFCFFNVLRRTYGEHMPL